MIVRRLLANLLGGPFDEPARMLRALLDEGATIHLPTAVVFSSELRTTYDVRRRHLAKAGRVMPGFELVTDLFTSRPNARWLLVGIEGRGAE